MFWQVPCAFLAGLRIFGRSAAFLAGASCRVLAGLCIFGRFVHFWQVKSPSIRWGQWAVMSWQVWHSHFWQVDGQ